MKIAAMFLCVAVSLCYAGLNVKRTNSQIKIDGKLDETVWQSCPEYRLDKCTKGKFTNPTTVKLAYDSKNLYVAFICDENRMNEIVNKLTHDEERDNAIWVDDCVEILLDPWGTRKQFYHLIVNTSGIIYDSFMGDDSWDGSLQTAVTRYPDKWIIEIAIPFSCLKVFPKGGERWLGNFCREEKPSCENTSLFPTPKGFADPQSFGKIEFEPVEDEVSFSLKQISDDRISADIRNGSDRDRQLKVVLKSVENGDVILHKNVDVKVGEVSAITFPYKVQAGTKNIDVQVTSADDGKTVYSNVIPLTNYDAAGASRNRVWTVRNPLYRELLSDEPAGMSKDGTIFWMHGLEYPQMRLFAMQYGLRYVYDEYLKLLADNKLLPFTNVWMLTTPIYNAAENYRKNGIKSILVANRTQGSEFKAGVKNEPFLCDPAVADTFIKSIDSCMKEKADLIWAVSPGDEIYEYDEKVGVELFETKKKEYAFIRQADEEIKKKYGSGIYGIPQNLKDENPYRWIGYRKWLNDRYADIFKKLYKRAKGLNPNVRIVSMDPIAFHHPYDFSRASEYCDIMVHQLYPRRDGSRADFGFITKLIVDLSGAEVWPCAHVEEYSGSFTPQEVVELVSQVFRNGGSGLDYYLADTVGRRAGNKYMHMEYWGAPDRWQTEMVLAAEARKMNKLKFPKPDCAILYSCDSYASQAPGIPSDEAEVAYTLLGPNAGSWFKFIDDNQIARDTVKLSDFKVIYVPFAPYQRPEVVRKLIKYVENGGILVCGDGYVFGRDTIGKENARLQTQLLGKNARPVADPGGVQSTNKVMEAVERLLPASSDGVNPPTEISLGKGKVYCFARNPFVLKSLRNADTIAFFKKFQKQLGLATDEKIWRFQFPMDLIKPLPNPQEECLTNNYIKWQSFNPLSINNVELNGTYTYSIAPDNIPDQGGVKDVPFSRGDLTDRRNAPAAGNVDCAKSRLEEWIVRYKKTNAFDIDFDFGKAYPVAKAVIFYSHSGKRSAIEVLGSADGKTWEKIGSAPQVAESPDDVRDVCINLSGTAVRYIRIHFDKRDDGNVLTLAEVEVWSTPQKAENQLKKE